MTEPDAKVIALIVAAIVALIIFLASPPGQFLLNVLSYIPGVVWKWIVGIVALLVVIIIVRHFTT